MSACDRRSYYPTQNGLFKLRKSDGDLAWECRALSLGTEAHELDNFHVDRFSSTETLVSGVKYDSDLLPQFMRVTESSGLVSTVEFTEDPDEEVDDNALNYYLMSDRTDDYLYITGGQIVTSPNYASYVVNRWDASDLSHLESTVISSPGGDMAGFRAVQGTDQFDIVRENVGGLYRYTSGSTTPDDSYTGASVFFSADRNFLVPTDGTYYYLNASSRRYKLDIATLTEQAFSAADGSLLRMAVRDGYIAATDGSVGNCAVYATSDMSKYWQSTAHLSRGMTVDVCANFSVFLGLSSGTNTATNTSYRVRAIDHSGSVIWTRDLNASNDRTSLRQHWPVPVISADESVVWVYGPLSHDGVGTGALKMSMYALDADDGSILWAFSGGPNSGAAGDGGAGLSLVEDGDYLYLTTLRCGAPKYR